MARPSHLVLTNNRSDIDDWLTEMLDKGWKLVSVDNGIFYFENTDVIVEATAEAMKRGMRDNGPIRGVIDDAADAGLKRAMHELR